MYNSTKHKVFLSFYHADDQKYKDKLETKFGSCMINKSVMDGEYDSDNSDEYIKRLIREDKISDSSVVVVLVGRNTKYRKHVDWEIYAGLEKSIHGNSGLIGILLPTVPQITSSNNSSLPERLADNVRSNYAKLYTWDYALSNFESIIQTAYSDRKLKADCINNTRLQKQKNG